MDKMEWTLLIHVEYIIRDPNSAYMSSPPVPSQSGDKWYIPAVSLIMSHTKANCIYRPLGIERVYMPLCIVADTLFPFQGDDTL